MSQTALVPVEFHGATLYAIIVDGVHHVALRPICDALGIDWEAQRMRIRRHPVLGETACVTKAVAADGKEREVMALPLSMLNGWLFGVSVNRVKPELREKLIQYQRECFDVLARHFLPTMSYSVQPGQTLSAEQADTLRNMLTTHVKRLPHAKQAGAMVKGWSKLKAHFGTDYRHIPAGEFHEAVSIIARHTAEFAEWELVDESPKLAHQPTVPEIVADWVEKIEQPNGYPAMLFMPLVNAVLRKMGFTLPGSELPRLTMTVTPPPIGSYKYDRANPYPRNGRTIEVAKSIVTDIQSWGHSLPNSPAKRDLIDATDTLYSLLVSGWTEVDEALGQISTAMHYLNRWQGLGGRLGNAS